MSDKAKKAKEHFDQQHEAAQKTDKKIDWLVENEPDPNERLRKLLED